MRKDVDNLNMSIISNRINKLETLVPPMCKGCSVANMCAEDTTIKCIEGGYFKDGMEFAIEYIKGNNKEDGNKDE